MTDDVCWRGECRAGCAYDPHCGMTSPALAEAAHPAPEPAPSERVALTDDECSRIVHASLNPARVLAGPDGHEGSGPDVLLTVVGEILAARLAQAEADAATDPAPELAEADEGASPDPSERVKLSEDREALEAACLEGLVQTEHGYRYRPAVAADLVESIIAARLAQAEADRNEYREMWERACARVGAASDRAEKADARADALAEQVAAVEALIPPDPELIEAGCSVLGQDLIAALSDPGAALARVRAEAAAEARADALAEQLAAVEALADKWEAEDFRMASHTGWYEAAYTALREQLSDPGAALARVRAEAGARALEDAAARASAELGWEKGGHTSTYSVRKWLRARAADLRGGGDRGPQD